MELRILTWNLFHGRDAPPDPALLTWRSRLLRLTERNATHAQVNRELLEPFAELLAAAEWDVALLQECPPRWAERLATRCGAEPHLVLTSRNIPGLGGLQAAAASFNPDLIASWEGGSNLTLVRSAPLEAPAIAGRRSLRLTVSPERRRMAFTRLASGLCVANLHASSARPAAERELPQAAAAARRWAGTAPLILGGDLNLRPSSSASVFAELARDHGLRHATAAHAIDHLLASGLEPFTPPAQWPPERREVPEPGSRAPHPLPIRLSDHPPVEAVYATDRSPQAPAH